MSTKISASILASDFSNLGLEVKRVNDAGADFIHLDVMDGHFVPNITFGLDVVKAIRPLTTLPFDAHLMVSNPCDYIEKFADVGCDYITIHAEAVTHLDRAIEQIHTCGKKAGIALNPATDESILKYIIEKLDLILVMTVNPGFSGQQFIHSQMKKIKTIRTMIDASSNKDIILSVDGGVNAANASETVNAGANVLVAGNAIFKQKDYKLAIDELKQVI